MGAHGTQLFVFLHISLPLQRLRRSVILQYIQWLIRKHLLLASRLQLVWPNSTRLGSFPPGNSTTMFYSSSPYNPDADIPSLIGRVALVTGGNAGIGFQTVKQLVKHGARVYLGARNESRATGAIAQLETQGILDVVGAGTVHWLPLDLATPSTTKSAAEDFMKREQRLDILGESPLPRLSLFAAHLRPLPTVNNAAV